MLILLLAGVAAYAIVMCVVVGLCVTSAMGDGNLASARPEADSPELAIESLERAFALPS